MVRKQISKQEIKIISKCTKNVELCGHHHHHRFNVFFSVPDGLDGSPIYHLSTLHGPVHPPFLNSFSSYLPLHTHTMFSCLVLSDTCNIAATCDMFL